VRLTGSQALGHLLWTSKCSSKVWINNSISQPRSRGDLDISVLPTKGTPALQKALVSRSARLFLVPCRSGGEKGSLGVTVVLSIYMRTEDPFLQLL
jgi:hypothetical protein